MGDMSWVSWLLLEGIRGLVAQMAVPYLSLPSNASVTGSVDKRGKMSSADPENPDLTRPVTAGKLVGSAGSLILSLSHGPMGRRPLLGQWWQGRGGEEEVNCIPGGI